MTEYSIPSVRKALFEYFREKAECRNRLAENQEPWDGPKNASYSSSLELVANYVAALPDDNTILQKLANCTYLFFPDGCVFSSPCTDECGCSQTDSEAIHCGPGGKVMDPADCAEWFECWAQIALDEYPKSVEWTNKMTGGDLLP